MAATKLTDATRPATPSTSMGWLHGARSCASGTNARRLPRTFAQHAPPLARRARRRVAAQRRHEPVQRRLQRVGQVASVPHHRQARPATQDTVHLVDGLRRGEPVQRLGHGDGVDGSGAEGDGLGHAAATDTPGTAPASVRRIPSTGSTAITAAPLVHAGPG